MCYVLCLAGVKDKECFPEKWHDYEALKSAPDRVKSIQREETVWAETKAVRQFSRSVMSDSLRPHGLQHIKPPCPSPTPGAYSNSRPLNLWCHPTISTSVLPFSSHLQSFPASGSFQKSQFFASGGQSIGVSVSASVWCWRCWRWNKGKAVWKRELPVAGCLWTREEWEKAGDPGRVQSTKELCVIGNRTAQSDFFFFSFAAVCTNIRSWKG